jgi:hypothetical protein
MIRAIAGIGVIQKNAQDAPGAIFSRGAATPVSRFRHAHRPGADHAIETFRDVEDDVDAATPVDAQNAPTGVWKSRKEREIPTAPTSIIFSSLTKRKNEDNKTTQINCPPNRIKSNWPVCPPGTLTPSTNLVSGLAGYESSSLSSSWIMTRSARSDVSSGVSLADWEHCVKPMFSPAYSPGSNERVTTDGASNYSSGWLTRRPVKPVSRCFSGSMSATANV